MEVLKTRIWVKGLGRVQGFRAVWGFRVSGLGCGFRFRFFGDFETIHRTTEGSFHATEGVHHIILAESNEAPHTCKKRRVLERFYRGFCKVSLQRVLSRAL